MTVSFLTILPLKAFLERRSSLAPTMSTNNSNYMDQYSATSEQSANYDSQSNLNQVKSLIL